MTSQWAVSLPSFNICSLRYAHPFEKFGHKKMRYPLLTLIKIVCRSVDYPAFSSFVIAACAPRVLTVIIKPFLSPKRVKIKISLFRRTFEGSKSVTSEKDNSCLTPGVLFCI